MRLLGMELDASNGSVFRIARLVEELARHGVNGAHFGATGRIVVAKLLKVVLEDVNDFIRLELALNTWRNAVDESIELLGQLVVVAQGFSRLPNEVLSVVRSDSVHTSVVVGLRLLIDHSVGGLQANLELFAVEQVGLSALLLERFQIVSALTRLLVDKLAIVIVAELATLHRDARPDQGSLIPNSEVFDLLDGVGEEFGMPWARHELLLLILVLLGVLIVALVFLIHAVFVVLLTLHVIHLLVHLAVHCRLCRDLAHFLF
mmetsp:Transcript_47835/g.63237  ORF Transcript_47835/g.63237 Transcript_47835/m.63237 type:complete len:261 (-) Transcript_47835:19-801(-)